MNEHLLILQIYRVQKMHSKKRKHPLPSYSIEQLKNWILNQNNFKELYDNWVNSNFDKMLIPSCDRINNDLPYSLDNLQLMTWAENKQKSHNEMRSGILKHGINPQKAVVAINIKTNEKLEFVSIMDASRKTNLSAANIHSVCKKQLKKDGKGNYYLPKTTGGYSWNYKL